MIYVFSITVELLMLFYVSYELWGSYKEYKKTGEVIDPISVTKLSGLAIVIIISLGFIIYSLFWLN